MSEYLRNEFKRSLETGFIDRSTISDLLYQPELLVNKKDPPVKILSTITQELSSCDAFYISVAFVTTSGVATIINSLKALETRGVKGKILVSQYLNFTQPEALRKLSKFKNIDLRIATKSNTHTKGYIFKKSDYYNLIIGSSNLTASALATNKEWNLKVSALYDSSITEKVVSEFEDDFLNGIPVTASFISEYENIYRQAKVFNVEIEKQHGFEQLPNVIPNSMQREALKNLTLLRKGQKKKALLISATGTGKTYLSAFDAKLFNAKKLLFVVHRLTIAKKSMESFQRIFGNEKTMGLYSGNRRELTKDFVFSTVQTISKTNHLDQFERNHFDYIIIDESHRSGAESYRRLIEYFTPQFLLGMTATPERTDGNDIFSLFDHNIAYEIRLNRAMEEDMLSQFHYYGVTDLSVNNEDVENPHDFNLLVTDERVRRIIETAEFYGSDNGITRGLVFCSRNKDAKELSEKFNLRGFRTIALSGDNSEHDRSEAIHRLESDNLTEKLDYIFTVDIFNEGVDIPKVNQILMIRPTESAIIFIQQLGRGLRKTDGKSFLTIVDFIGNYKNNYLIPVALYGDTSYNKDTLRRLLSEGSREIPGASTVNFDEITKDRIFKSIDSANMQLFADLKKDYFLLKYKLGHVPMMMDFVNYGSRDPYLYINYSNSYFNFVKKADSEFKDDLPPNLVRIIELFSKEINNGKRVEESIILKELLIKGQFNTSQLSTYLEDHFQYIVSIETIESSINNLNFKFIREKKDGQLLPSGDVHDIAVLTLTNDDFEFTTSFKKHLENSIFRMFLLDSIEYSINKFSTNYSPQKWDEGFLLYAKYSRKDVFRILNFAENPVAQNVGGYLVSKDNRYCPVFVNYHKEDDISESTKYADEFVNSKEIDYMSKSNRRISSSDVQSILGNKGSIRIPLFIKKNNDEGMDFYYMGNVVSEKDLVEQSTILNDKGNQIPVVKFRFNLHTPVIDTMYQYLTENHTRLVNRTNPIISVEPQTSIAFPIKAELSLIQVPLYNFYAAAGSFSEMQSEKDYTLISLPQKYNSNSDYFACKIMGESMNRVIPNGSVCLFKKYDGGSRNGKIVLVENYDYQDPDFNSSFTVKTYSSKKIVTKDNWQHTTIILRPNSTDGKYEDIVLSEENGSGMRVIGEFVEVL